MLKLIEKNRTWLLCLIFIAISVIIRYPKSNIYNYYNSDATMHTLLTMQSYEETPLSVHKFLPINSLGEVSNKFIVNGPSLAFDQYGNNYYTSFSPVGFYIPYIFVKIFNLPINEQSIYLFNSIISILCIIFLGKLFKEIFKDKISTTTLMLTLTVLYLFQKEVMHSQGISFWVQSIFQLLLIVQMYLCVTINRKSSKILFFILCLLMPYVEWTGYISNIGFIIYFLINRGVKFTKEKVEIKVECIINSILILLLTMGAFILFYKHFTLVIDGKEFIDILMGRFMARNITTNVTIGMLFKGYWQSYSSLIVILISGLGITLGIKRTRTRLIRLICDYKCYIFMLTFPTVENIIMIGHAVTYSFDRLKAVIPLLFLLIILIIVWKQEIENRVYIKKILVVILIGISICNLYGYSFTDNPYRWKVDYLEQNSLFANEIVNKYSHKDSIIVQQGWRAWGYTQLLFGRNIYCTDLYSNNQIEDIMKSKDKRFCVYILPTELIWDKGRYNKAIIVDIKNNSVEVVECMKDGKIIYKKASQVVASSLSDQNWTNGILNESDKILFENNQYNRMLLHNARSLECEGLRREISEVEINEGWITVRVENMSSIEKFSYPNNIQVIK